jgi:hypothetical protein
MARRPTAKQLAARKKFVAWVRAHRLRSRSTNKIKTRGNTMARRKGYRRSSGFGMGRLFSAKNLMFTAAGAILAPKLLGINGKLGAAVGGFMGAGPIGAAAGYFAAPLVLGASNSSQNF